MKQIRKLMVLLAVLLAVNGWAQPMTGQRSVICNDNGTVTFNYKNDQAKKVLVDVQFAGRKEMKRNAKTGLWTVTVGPAAPDMYPYCFIVDGVSVMDPENPQYFPNEGFKSSLLEIPSRKGALAHDIKSVPHGRMEYIHYYSKSLGGTNNAIVYLPPNYIIDKDKKYPVFYLISGTTDTEEVYYKVGRVNYILDNLLAEKAAQEMIVVLPYGNPYKLLPAKQDSLGMPQTRFGGDVFSNDLMNDLMPYIEKNYRTINDADHRAIGGFSRGGNQALFNGLSHLDKFSYLCSYSSFTSTDIPRVYDNAAETNKKINLFWLGVGTDDFLYGNARDYMEFLDKKGIRSVKEYTTDKYGHTWMNAKYFLAKTLPLLFNKEASAAAMQAGKPALAATGKEPQFTPGVMARLFPKPIISPEYTEQGIVFRIKAPDAKKVVLECEILTEPLQMEKDADGVWSAVLTDSKADVFKYCFVVDGTRTADPQNMYLSPDKGFKYSIAANPQSPYHFASQDNIAHGTVSYYVDRQEAWYASPKSIDYAMPAFIQLVPGKDDTMESWFKVGGADAIADRLIADGKTKPCIITTSTIENLQQGTDFEVNVLRADDYSTWAQRRQALIDLLLRIGEAPARYQHPFQNPDLSYEERVENLISLLTPEEKVGLMMNKSASVDRLGIPSYNWWSEACHGVRQSDYTVYPQPIGMAAAFNAQLVYDVFSTVSDEARANWNRSNHNIFNVPMGEIYYPGNPELTFWCPNVNIFRDPRWGRGQETCGEDPYMNAVLGVQTVLGMQGNDSHYFKTHACAKHYAVHSGPEPLRHSMNVDPSNRDLWETYLPAFKALVKKANVREVMCAYQRFEGKPCCTSDRLLIDILRNKWGYDGLVVTDCDAINNFYNKGQHETHKDPLSASVDAVLNGTDLECGKVFMTLTEGLEKGMIQETDLDQHLRKTLYGRMELGMFDPANRLPWAGLGQEVISSEANNELAIQAARESMVLLENKNVLPLSKSIKTIAVVGPNADDIELLNGNYGGTPTKAHQHSLLEGIKAAVPAANVIYQKACELNDEYETIHHLQDFNDGRGVSVEFWNNRNLQGEPVKTGYYKELAFTTFGAWGFAEGVNNDSLSVRVSGKYKATFTGEMKYSLTSDNGYVMKVNGEVIETAKPHLPRGGYFHRSMQYQSFPVKEGETYDIVIEYRRGNGQFAMLRGDICERNLVDFAPLAEEVRSADVIIVIGGISAQMEGEGGDKADIELPKVQQRLLRAMHATGRPVVFVNCSGSAIAFGSVEGEYDALLQAWYAGQGGSRALADVLFGDYNPGGKLPVTFYRSTDDLPDFLDYSMANRTYRYFKGKPQYAFGYGLSYTTFAVGKGKLSAKSMEKGGKVTLTVPVTNTGKREGTETVQVYVKALDDAGAPIKALKGFQKLSLKAGETATAEITLDDEAFEYYDESIDELAVRRGRYQIMYGTSSLDSDLQKISFVVK